MENSNLPLEGPSQADILLNHYTTCLLNTIEQFNTPLVMEGLVEWNDAVLTSFAATYTGDILQQHIHLQNRAFKMLLLANSLNANIQLLNIKISERIPLDDAEVSLLEFLELI